MEKIKIGENAGRIWHTINELEKITIPELSRKLDLSVESTAMAIGWLARENQICIWTDNGLTMVSPSSRFSENRFG